MNLEEIETIWASVLVPESAGIGGRRAPGTRSDQPVYLAVDARGHRHLLVQTPDDTPPINQRGSRALDVSTARFQVGSNPEALYVDLACTDPSQHPTFSAVTHDFLRALASTNEYPHEAITKALARWRAFWSTGAPGMTAEAALGLFGELWFMRRWLAPVGARVMAAWQASRDSRHDFQWTETSVEVKTSATRTNADPVHAIGGLDQLASPESGKLFLFSLHVRDDALATNTLHALVGALAIELQDDFQALGSLNEKLAERGYNPSDRQAPTRTLRILAERLYRVDDRFPRLTRKSLIHGALPPGVVDISYSIDIAACSESLAASAPGDQGTSVLRMG